MTAVSVPVAAPVRAAPTTAVAATAILGATAAVLTAAGAGIDGPFAPDRWSLVRGCAIALYVAAGVYTWLRRPDGRFGWMLAQLGPVYALAALSASHEDVPYTLGRVALAGFVVAYAYVFLCFPGDRLGTRAERRVVTALVVITAVGWAVALPVLEELPPGGTLVECGDECGTNVLHVASLSADAQELLRAALGAITALVLLAVIGLLARKALSPSRLRRRTVAPLLAAVASVLVAYVAYSAAREAGVEELGPFRALGAAASLAVPIALLVGQVRGRLFAASKIVDLVARAGRESAGSVRVETLLREAVGDPTLRLLLRSPAGGYVDVAGDARELPRSHDDVAVTTVVRHGRAVAALVHDPALDDGSGTAEGLAATALMLLENAQLVEDLRASRARIVEAAHRERGRLERNLHDGAQQRLFGLQLRVAEAQKLAADPALAASLERVADEAAAAADELRALAQGLYPTVLRERGLPEALRAAARDAPIAVRFEADDVGRASATVEEAVYFCVLEALQNVAKHGGDGVAAAVTLARVGPDLLFAVADDGAGFDPLASRDGTGLVGMRDRLGAVDGTLEVESRPGVGTRVDAIVPHAFVPSG